jgi:hypothetical protein
MCLFGLHPASAQTPKAKWAVDGTGAFCTLSRTVEEGPTTASTPATSPSTTLVLRTYPGTQVFNFMVIRGSVPGALGPKATMSVSFAPSGGPFVKPVSILPLGAGVGKALAVDYLSPDFLESFAGAALVNVAIGKKAIGSYAIPNAAKAVDAFRACESAKLIEWGADAAAFEPGGRQPEPVGDSGKWIGYDDLQLPRGDMRNFTGFAVARLTIATDGHVEACSLLDTNRNRTLDAIACKLLGERARYEPARDKDDKPVRSVALYRAELTVVNTVTWEKF